MSNFEPSGGPKNRFKKANRQADLAAQRRRFEKEADKKNTEGEYVCADCRLWYTIEEFQYVHEGETKVARRCASCRRDRRAQKWHGRS